MKTRSMSLMLAIVMTFALGLPNAHAIGAKEGAASLLLPATGQAMNGEWGSTKTNIMAAVEVGALTTVAILGTLVGGGVVWAGLGPMIANRAWSAVDAYKGAQDNYDPALQQKMTEAQKTLEISRQRRYEREQAYRSDIHDRVARAGETAYLT